MSERVTMDSLRGDTQPLDPLSEVKDETTSYFESLGYQVTWDHNRSGRWYELLDDDGLFCQLDFGVPLGDLMADLPYLIEDKRGTSKSEYQLNCPSTEKLRELYKKMQANPPAGS